MRTSRDTASGEHGLRADLVAQAPEPEGGFTIDCDCCSLRQSAACEDCVVTFLLGREADDAVVIDADEARAMRMLGRAGLVPELRFSSRVG